MVLVVVVLVLRRSKNAPHRHYQLQLGLYKQKHTTDKPSIAKPDSAGRAGKAGGFLGGGSGGVPLDIHDIETSFETGLPLAIGCPSFGGLSTFIKDSMSSSPFTILL